MSAIKQIRFDESIDWKYIIQYGFGLSIFAYLIFIGGRGGDILGDYYIARANIVLFTFLFSYWAFISVISEKKSIENEYTSFALLFLGVTFISVLLSDSFWQSFSEFYLWGLYFLIFIGIQYLIYWGWKREIIFNCVLIIGGLSNLSKIVLRGLWFSNWLSNANQGLLTAFQYRGIAPNQSAAFANLVLMMALAKFVNNKNNRKDKLLIFIILISVIVVFLTSSRGGMLGMAAGAGIIFVTSIVQLKDLITEICKTNKRIIYGGVVLGMALLLFSVISTQNRGTIDARYVVWMSAFQAFIEHPVFGNGLYTMGNQLLRNMSVPPGTIHVHAHNVFLNILGELGIVGFSVFMLLIIGLANTSYRNINRNNCFIALGMLGALGSFLTHGLVDTLYVEPYISMTLISIASLASVPEKKTKYIPKPIMRSSSFWVAGCVLCFGWILLIQRIPLENAIRHYEKSKEFAIADFEKLEKWKPKWALLYQQRAITESFLAIEDKKNQMDHIYIAIEYYEKAIKYDSLWASNYANLGVLYKVIGENAQALEMMKRAASLAPNSALIALNYAIIAEEYRDYDLAEHQYWNYILLGGLEISGHFWQETPLRTKIFHNNRKRIFLDNIIIWGAEGASSEIMPGKFSKSEHLRLAEHYYNRGEYNLAQKEIRVMELMGVKAGETYLELLWMKARLEIQEGEYEKGLDYAQFALDGWRYQSIYGPGTYGRLMYSNQLHRSTSIKDDLIPQFEIAPIPETWINRMVTVGCWYKEINLFTEAENILYEVIEIDKYNKEAKFILEKLSANRREND